jgi:hypothetical protein
MAPTVAAVVSFAAPLGAQVVFLQNDSFTGGPVSCYTGVTNNSGLGAKFTASPGQYPYTIDRIRVFGCGGGQDAYAVGIFQDNGDTAPPGPLIWQSKNAYFLSGANVFNDILLAAQEPLPPPPITSGNVRIQLFTISILQPIGFGRDTNGIQPHRNFVQSNTGAWFFAENPPYNFGGDWILRLGILPPASQPSLSVLDAIVVEGGNGGPTPATFTVTLSPASSQTVTVDYGTADETATAPSDYQAQVGTLTFAPGETLKTVSVNVIGDDLNEDDETFLLNLQSPVGATLADGEGRGFITNDDPLPSLAVSDATVSEGDTGTTPATFTVTLTPASGRPVAVNYATVDGTATSPGDYTGGSGTLAFPPLATSRTFSVPVNGDTLDELNESFTVALSGAANATVADGQGQGVIVDDEVPGADFNADGATDILWRHQGSGQNVVWFMNGVSLQSGTFTTPPALADPNWSIAGTSDFDQDEQSDILWRHGVSGENVLWHMNGSVLRSGTFTNPSALADTGWQIGATGDFDADGKPDILWRHSVSGQIVLWFMDDATLVSGTLTTPPTLDPVWRAAASGDYNRDGRADILWHHRTSGELVVWYMNGATLLGGTFTSPSALADVNWQAVGAGDFNLDTRTDILWRHSVSGEIVVWYMNGTTLLGGTFTNPSAFADVNWKIVGPR